MQRFLVAALDVTHQLVNHAHPDLHRGSEGRRADLTESLLQPQRRLPDRIEVVSPGNARLALDDVLERARRFLGLFDALGVLSSSKLRQAVAEAGDVATAGTLLGQLAGRDERRGLTDDKGILHRYPLDIDDEPRQLVAAAKGTQVKAKTAGRLRSHDRGQFLTVRREPERSLCDGLKLLVHHRDHSSKNTHVAVGDENERNRAAQRLFAPLAPTYDRYARLLSFGQDPRWRRFLVSRVRVGADDTVLDVATGTGAVALELATRYGCRVVGVDQSVEMLDEARARIEQAGLVNRIELVHGRAEDLPFAERQFAAATFTYLLRYVDEPLEAVQEVARVVRPGGAVGSLEFHVPPNAIARTAWSAYTRVGLPTLGRLVSPGWREVGRFLNPSIRSFCARWPPEAQAELWHRAGLVDVQTRLLSYGGGLIMWANRGN